MSDIKVDDRVKVLKAPVGDEDIIGREGTVIESDFIAILVGFDYTVRLDEVPARVSEMGTDLMFFYKGELELV